MADLTIASLRREQRIIDRQVVDYALTLFKPFYQTRRESLNKIPRFWSIVMGETEPLRSYITFEDSLAFDALEDIFIEWDAEDSRNFEITFRFGDNPHFSAQSLLKKLVWHESESDSSADNDSEHEGYYTSPKPTVINWNSESKLIQQHLNGGEESFFTWFEYTTADKPEVRQENTIIAQVLVDEIYPAAMDLYVTAQDDQMVAEEYDISDDE